MNYQPAVYDITENVEKSKSTIKIPYYVRPITYTPPNHEKKIYYDRVTEVPTTKKLSTWHWNFFTFSEEPWRLDRTTRTTRTTTTTSTATITSTSTITSTTTTISTTTMITALKTEADTTISTDKPFELTTRPTTVIENVPFVNKTQLIDDNCMKCLCFVSIKI